MKEYAEELGESRIFYGRFTLKTGLYLIVFYLQSFNWFLVELYAVLLKLQLLWLL